MSIVRCGCGALVLYADMCECVRDRVFASARASKGVSACTCLYSIGPEIHFADTFVHDAMFTAIENLHIEEIP